MAMARISVDVSAQSANGIVLDRAGGLDPVVHVSGDVFQAERIFFGAGGWLGHGRCLQQRDDSGGGKGIRATERITWIGTPTFTLLQILSAV